MDAESAFESYLNGGLAVYGIEADETEREVMKGVFSVYRPPIEQLLALDLSAIEPEPDPDLSRAPRK